MRITTTEQSLLGVGARTDEAKGCLSREHAALLVDLRERIGARVASWQSPNSLRMEQFVGIVRVGELQVEILPKLDCLPEPSAVRKNLLEMLAVTQDLDVFGSELVGFLKSDEPFLCALARLYCHRLLRLVRRGLRQEYVPHEELLPFVRGKIDWAARVKLAPVQRLEFPCQFDERSQDTLLNRTLKAALVEVGRLLQGSPSSAIVRELRHSMDSVGDHCPSSEEIQRLRTNRVNRGVEPVLALAKLILGNRSPDIARGAAGEARTYALVWDMNVLFEEYVGRMTRKVLRESGFTVDLQEAGKYLAVESGSERKVFLLRPDIVVRRGRAAVVIADTKWKRLDPRRPNLDVSGPDAYQILAYAQRYGAERCILIFPHHPALGAPGVLREFQTIEKFPGSRAGVRILALDLAALDSIPTQLQHGILGALEQGVA